MKVPVKASITALAPRYDPPIPITTSTSESDWIFWAAFFKITCDIEEIIQVKIKIRKYPAIFLNGTHISMIIPGYDENEEKDEEEKES